MTRQIAQNTSRRLGPVSKNDALPVSPTTANKAARNFSISSWSRALRYQEFGSGRPRLLRYEGDLTGGLPRKDGRYEEAPPERGLSALLWSALSFPGDDRLRLRHRPGTYHARRVPRQALPVGRLARDPSFARFGLFQRDQRPWGPRRQVRQPAVRLGARYRRWFARTPVSRSAIEQPRWR